MAIGEAGGPVSQVFNEDCMIGMGRFKDKFFDLAIVDPPYGRKEHGGKNRSTFAVQKNGSQSLVKCGDYKKGDWDNTPPSRDYFDELVRVSKHQIIWGVNYFPYYFGPGRIVWDKVNAGSDQSACEIAYNSMSRRVDLFRFMWRGMMQGKSIQEGHIQQGNKKLNEKRIHPTQKPVVLYKWLLQNYAMGGIILDTHRGSGSLEIACYELGYEYYGWEIDPVYFEAASLRKKAFMEMRALNVNEDFKHVLTTSKLV